MARLKEKKYRNKAIIKISKLLNLSYKQLGFELGLCESTIYNYILGRRNPKRWVMLTMLDYCHKRGINIEENQFYSPFPDIEFLTKKPAISLSFPDHSKF